MAYVKLVNGDATYHFVDENSAQRMLQPSDLPLSTAYSASVTFWLFVTGAWSVCRIF